MTHTADAPLKPTPLNARHRSLGARMVPFAGWDMPVEYSGLSQEHLAVRTRAGLFDVSHMGQIEIAGTDALDAVQWITSNDAARLKIGQAHYSGLTTPAGTFVDDLLVYRFADDHFLLVVNASNVEKDVAWIAEQTRRFDVAAVDTSARYALIALQGPLARQVMQRLSNVDLAAIKYYWFAHGEIAGVRGTISRTGYTGEDGFEVFVPPQQAVAGVGRDPRRGPGRRRDSRRPRRPRHAAPRSGDAPLRQRHRRHDDGARSRPRVDRRLEQGRLPRARGPAPTRRPGASPAGSSGSR